MNAFYFLLYLLFVYAVLLSGSSKARGDDAPAAPATSVTKSADAPAAPAVSASKAADAPVAKDVSAAKGDSAAKTPAPPAKGPPLPLHTIEGVGGIVITPTAYLVNAPPAGGDKPFYFGNLAASATYVGAGRKNVQSVGITDSITDRIEIGYGFSRFGLGTLRDDVRDATTVDIGRDDVYLHNFNLRYQIVKESEHVPAVTAGVHFKVNDGIGSINNKLGGALKAAGIGHTSGTDFTLTASKTFGNVFGRPLIASGGLRLSKAAQLGYLGFTDDYHASFEGNLVYLITDHVGLAYEFRQKVNNYTPIGDLVKKEQNWQTVGVGIVLSNYTTVTVGYGHFGDVLNTRENAGWAIQLKHEF